MVNQLISRTEKYQKLTEKALKKSKICVAKDSASFFIAKDFIDMASRYLEDGKYYKKKGEYEIALASFAYAHAWLDCLARLGLTDVKGDNKLFTLFK
jgi:hypothetical protein